MRIYIVVEGFCVRGAYVTEQEAKDASPENAIVVPTELIGVDSVEFSREYRYSKYDWEWAGQAC